MYIEPSSLIILTTEKKFYNTTFTELFSKIEGMELYIQPYRWDQKIFAIYLSDEVYEDSLTAPFGDPVLMELCNATKGNYVRCANLTQCVSDINNMIDLMHRNQIRINFFPLNDSLRAFSNPLFLTATKISLQTKNTENLVPSGKILSKRQYT